MRIKRKSGGVGLQCEALEPRRLMTVVSLSTSPDGSGGQILHVIANAGDDEILILPGPLTTVSDGVGDVYGPYYDITGFAVDAGAGNNEIQISDAFRDPSYSAYILAGPGNDRITIEDGPSTINATVFAGAGNDTIFGGKGDDALFGGKGADEIDGGAGTNYLVGGRGADTLVGIGGDGDALVGGLGQNSFWTNANATETSDVTPAEAASDAWHAVSSFQSYNAVTGSGLQSFTPPEDESRTRSYPDPLSNDRPYFTEAAIPVADFPLFAPSGPSPRDVVQREAGDCYFLASLSAIAAVDPQRLRQMVVQLGDGSYVVQFFSGGKPVYFRVSGSLARNSGEWNGGSSDPNPFLFYATLGPNDVTWAAIMEKAYTEFKGPPNAPAGYADIDGGFVGQAFKDLGVKNLDRVGRGAFANNFEFTQAVQSALSAGQAVAYGTGAAAPASGVPLIALHAYQVVGTTFDAAGNPALILRNPWGVDLANGVTFDGRNDGYVTVSASDVLANMLEIDAGAF